MWRRQWGDWYGGGRGVIGMARGVQGCLPVADPSSTHPSTQPKQQPPPAPAALPRPQAAAYRFVLYTASQNERWVRTDDLQLLHTKHNLLEALDLCGRRGGWGAREGGGSKGDLVGLAFTACRPQGPGPTRWSAARTSGFACRPQGPFLHSGASTLLAGGVPRRPGGAPHAEWVVGNRKPPPPPPPTHTRRPGGAPHAA